MKTYLVLAIALLLNVTSLNAQDKNPAWSGTLSMVVPGLGHIYNGDIGKGCYFAFFETVYIAGMYGAYNWNEHDRTMFLMSAGFAAFKISDVYFAIKGAKRSDVSISLAAVGNQPAVGLSLKF